MGYALGQILEWFYGAVLGAFDAVVGLITRTLLVTPEVTGLPQVQALTGRSILVVDTAFVLAFIAAGAVTVVAGGDEYARYTVKDLVPRCVVGFVAAHFSQLLCGQAVTLANALTGALTGKQTDRDLGLKAVRSHLDATAGNQGVVLLLAVLVVLVVVLLVATAFSAITRFALVLVLTAVAPLALACHALPQTDPVARLWWRSYLGCLAIPVLQGFTLQAGQWMFLDPRHTLPEFPVTGAPGTVVNLLVVIVLLWTTVRVPGLVRRYVTAGGSRPNPLGTVVRLLVVRRLAQVAF